MLIFSLQLSGYCEMSTFQVDPVAKSTTSLRRANLGELLTYEFGGAKPESHFKLERTPVQSWDNNAFVSAVHNAYASHYPLVLTPDHIWMCIAQGLSQHVNANPDKLRNLFVEHEGKKELHVRRDDFVKGSPDNPWPEVFEEFSEQIQKHVGGKTHDLLTPNFTTTGPTERAAAQVVLMDTFKEYFGYVFHTLCGIPEITLEGTIDDWKKLREKALDLAQYDLDWWIKALKLILDQFVKAASGEIDTKFWSSVYKENNMSGGPYISGWIVVLFPYTYQYISGEGKKLKPNPCLAKWSKKTVKFDNMPTLQSDNFPRGTVSTPFKWDYLGTEIPMFFYAGFMAVSQDPTSLSVRPEIGWAVVDEKEEKSAKLKPFF